MLLMLAICVKHIGIDELPLVVDSYDKVYYHLQVAYSVVEAYVNQN